MQPSYAVDVLRASTGWKKSSRSGGGVECVEVNRKGLPGWVGIRDTKLGEASPIIVVSAAAFDRFLSNVQALNHEI